MLGAPNSTKSLPFLHNLNIDNIKTALQLEFGFSFDYCNGDYQSIHHT